MLKSSMIQTPAMSLPSTNTANQLYTTFYDLFLKHTRVLRTQAATKQTNKQTNKTVNGESPKLSGRFTEPSQHSRLQTQAGAIKEWNAPHLWKSCSGGCCGSASSHPSSVGISRVSLITAAVAAESASAADFHRPVSLVGLVSLDQKTTNLTGSKVKSRSNEHTWSKLFF